MNHHGYRNRHHSGCRGKRWADHGHPHEPMSDHGHGCGPAMDQEQRGCRGPSHHHHSGRHGMPLGRPHGFGMGHGPTHAWMWAGARIEPDRAMLEAKLAYLIAWRNRLDSVIEDLAARLDDAACCCRPAEPCECEEHATEEQAPCSEDAAGQTDEPR